MHAIPCETQTVATVVVWSDVVIESLADMVNGVVLALDVVVSVSYFVEVLSDVMVEAFTSGIDMNANVSASVMTALDFSMSEP